MRQILIIRWTIAYIILGYAIPIGLAMTDHSPQRSMVVGAIMAIITTIAYNLSWNGRFPTEAMFRITSRKRLLALLWVMPITAISIAITQPDQKLIWCLYLVPMSVLAMELSLYTIINLYTDTMAYRQFKEQKAKELI